MKILTVILSDYSEFQTVGEPVRHRSVHIALNENQLKMISPKLTHTINEKDYYEEISQCFIEEIF